MPGTGNAGRPLARFGITSDINMIQPFGDTTYHALQTELRGRARTLALRRRLHALAHDELRGQRRQSAHSAAASSRSSTSGPAGYDRTHNLQTYWVWDLPFGKDRRWAAEGVASALFGGWQVNGVMSLMSGTPINIIQGTALQPQRRRQRPVSRIRSSRTSRSPAASASATSTSIAAPMLR